MSAACQQELPQPPSTLLVTSMDAAPIAAAGCADACVEIHGLPLHCSESEVAYWFQSFCRAAECVIPPSLSGVEPRRAYVKVSSHEAARLAIGEWNSTQPAGPGVAACLSESRSLKDAIVAHVVQKLANHHQQPAVVPRDLLPWSLEGGSTGFPCPPLQSDSPPCPDPAPLVVACSSPFAGHAGVADVSHLLNPPSLSPTQQLYAAASAQPGPHFHNSPSLLDALHGGVLPREQDAFAPASLGLSQQLLSLYLAHPSVIEPKLTTTSLSADLDNHQLPKPASLYVKNLPETASPKLWIYEKFAPFGPIMSVNVLKDPDGKCRGVGFVNYSDSRCAKRAVYSLHNTKYGDKVLQVSLQNQRVRIFA